jgi:hypothetical protein
VRWCLCPHEVLYDSFEFAAATSFVHCCRRAEAVSGLVFDSHQLVHNGEVLSGKSLAEYGVQKGSVLELVPYEPFVPETMPESSPLLSSPAHELVIFPATFVFVLLHVLNRADACSSVVGDTLVRDWQ